MRLAPIASLLVLCTTTFADIHVRPSSEPYVPLAPVVETARKLADKKIILHGGAYYDTAITLIPQDSGLSIEAAPGEKPVLVGGIPLSGFRRVEDGTWSLPLPKDRHLEPRLLIVNDRLASRARFPESGALTHLSEFKVPWMSTTGGGWKRKPTDEELTTLKFNANDLPPTLDARGAEITVYHMWDESRVGLAAIDRENNLIKFSSPAGHPPGAFGVQKYAVWNVREGLTRLGQWCHDRVNNRILYRPLPHEKIDSSHALIPTTERILTLRGTPQSPIRNVTIRGITFSTTTVPLVAAGFAAGRFDGAITLENADACTLADLSVSDVAGHGIKARSNCSNIRVENCEVTDCGAGGIYVGGDSALISDNLVRSIGLAFPSAIGIHGGGRNARVACNEVHDTPYSAINYAGENAVIEHNLLYDCMKTLHDGGAIYVFGGKGTVLRRNVARDFNDTGGYGASAYYLDETSENCIVEENISLNVAWPSHNHMAKDNTIRRNVFVSPGDMKITFQRSSGYTFDGNVLFAQGKILIENPDGIATWSKNILHSATGRYEAFNLNHYARTGPAEAVRGDTITSDPLFVNREKADFTYANGSPAAQLNLPVLEMTQAGRRAKKE